VIAGRYSRVREIGHGGMSPVWLGHDEVLDRAVALKRIGLVPGAEETDLARAEREARHAARFNHPNVVAVLDLVVDDESGSWWLVMEYVEGTTLARLVRDEGALSPDDAAPLLRQVADGLLAAHSAGIVHRDVKPSNVLVDRDRQVKLADFGIARTTADPTLTRTGMITGSPAYLAPEVAAGGRGDEAADVWSLGATVFHLLSGRPPYDIGENVLGGLYRIIHEDPPRLPQAGWMAALLDATLVKDPAGRWSMAQVRDFLAQPHRGSDALPYRRSDARPGPQPTAQTPAETVAMAPVPGPARSPQRAVVALVVLALAVVVGLVLLAVLPGRDRSTDTAGDEPTAKAAQTRSGAQESTQSTPERDQTPGTVATETGMRSFVRAYVEALSANPDSAWQMLTPRFQQESGGLDTYRAFWSGVGTGHVRDIAADPDSLVVSYRVRFDQFGTGRRPTVLKLVRDDGRYLIDRELTQGAG
jgi:eukaryotic-like serine/threonine-protein kinase